MKLYGIISTFLASKVFSQRSECEWLAGSHGQPVECLPGWIALGACGSGRNADCKMGLRNKSFTKLLCCHTKYDNDPRHDCQEVDGGDGEEIYCPVGSDGSINELTTLCSSGRTADCQGTNNRNHYDFIRCCESSDVTLGAIEYCSWRYGNYGDDLECPAGYALGGFCGSGGNGKCGAGDTYTGILCCPFTDNKG